MKKYPESMHMHYRSPQVIKRTSRRDACRDTRNLFHTLAVVLVSSLTGMSNNALAQSNLEKIAQEDGNESQQSTATMISDICPQMAQIQDQLNDAQTILFNECAALVNTANDVSGDPANPDRVIPGYGSDDLLESLQQIAHEEVAAQGTSATDIIDGQVSNVAARVHALRVGGASPVGGLSFNFNGDEVPATLFSELVGSAATGGGASSDADGFSKWGYFLSGVVNFGEKDETNREAGFDYDTFGVTGGADYRVSDRVVIGAALGYNKTDADFDHDDGDADTDTTSVSVFGSFFQKNNFYVDGMFNYGRSNYDTVRNISFPQSNGNDVVDDVIKGDTDGTHYVVNVGAGKDFFRPGTGLSFGLYGRLNYYDADIDGYAENGTGSSSFELEVEDQDIESLVSIVGARISKAFSRNFGVLVPRAMVEYHHEFEDDSRGITARYVHVSDLNISNQRFSIPTDDPDRDYFFAGLGLSAVFRGGTQTFIHYETTLGLDDIENNAFVLGLRGEI